MSDKPRYRVPAGGEATGSKSFVTGDSFQNLAAQLGYGAQNIGGNNSYGFNPITRNHTQLEWMYRGSWLVRQIVDAVADDMTRSGIQIDSHLPPDDLKLIDQHFQEMMIWQRINSTIKWSRLYGGCIALIMIEGQRVDAPLVMDSIGKGQFKGLIVLDRWMIWPHQTETVTEIGPDFGKPAFYQIIADVRGLPKMKIHHSRVIRLDGVELPYWQTISENGWGLSVIEPLLDRMVAFDSVTQGAAQLAFKAHLRVMKVDGLRELVASGGLVYQAFLQQMAIIRLMQTNEGMTVMDKEDDFQVNQYSFAGLSDLLVQFGQQLSGASQIPLTRLFGQSPSGMSATGESDLRNYYDSIRAQQETRLRRPVTVLLDVVHRSLFGRPVPDGFTYSFTPLWQLTETEKATIAGQVTTFVDTAKAGGLIGSAIALRELQQSSKVTGYFSNITDEDIDDAEKQDALPDPMQQPGMPGVADPNAPQQAAPPTTPEADSNDGEDGPNTPIARRVRKGNKRIAALYPNKNGATMKDLPIYARRLLSDKADVQQTYAGKANGHTLEDVKALYTSDENSSYDAANDYPMRDVHGLTVVIETEKGNRRVGYGWAATLAADYGYISGTSSAEGGAEQMDCFVGEDAASLKIWVIQQVNPKTQDFDESKVMLCFPNKDAAVSAYKASFSDGSGDKRIGRVVSTDISSIKSWLAANWQYSTAKGPDHSGEHAAP